MNVLVYTILTGIFWGAWPIIMGKSGVSGFVSATIFAGTALVMVVVPGLITGQLQKTEMNILLFVAILAGLIGGAGLICFTTMLSKASGAAQIATMIMIMLMFQIAIPAIYKMVSSGDYSPKTIGGIVLAMGAAWLLK